MTPVTIAKAVMEDLGIAPIIEPIRGGTDGSKISFMGNSYAKYLRWWRKYARPF